MSYRKISNLLNKANKLKEADWALALYGTYNTYDADSSERVGYTVSNNRELINKMVLAIINSIDFQANANGYADWLVELLRQANEHNKVNSENYNLIVQRMNADGE